MEKKSVLQLRLDPQFKVVCFCFLFFVFLERGRESRGEAEREGDRESQASRLCVASTESDMGLESMNREIMT